MVLEIPKFIDYSITIILEIKMFIDYSITISLEIPMFIDYIRLRLNGFFTWLGRVQNQHPWLAAGWLLVSGASSW
jgi:hypothetical protein